MVTIRLNDEWDIEMDPTTNDIGINDGNKRLAQDVASAVRCFLNENYYNYTDGIDYFGFFNSNIDSVMLQHQIIIQAKRVEGCNDVKLVNFEINYTKRKITGVIVINPKSDEEINIPFEQEI